MADSASTVNEKDLTAFLTDFFKARDYLRQRCLNNEKDPDLAELITRMNEFETDVPPRVKGLESFTHKTNKDIPSNSEQVLASDLETIKKHKEEITTLKTSKHSIEESLMAHNFAIRDVEHRDIERYENMERQMIFYVEKQNISSKVLGRVLLNYAKLSQRFDVLQTQVQQLSKTFTKTKDTLKTHISKLEDGVKAVTRDQKTETNNLRSEITSMKEANQKTDSITSELNDKITAHTKLLAANCDKIHDLDISTHERISGSEEAIKNLQTSNESLKGSVDKIEINVALQSVTVGLVTEVSKKHNELFASVNKKCDTMVNRIEIQDKKIDEVKAELSKSILESSTKSDSLLKQLDSKILTEKTKRCDEVKKVVYDINLIKEENKKRDTQLEELFKKSGDCINQRTKIFDTVVELEKKTRDLEENLLLDVRNLQGSVKKLNSEVSKQDETIKSQQVKLQELKVNFNNKLQKEIKNRSEKVSRVEVDILLIKGLNKTTDSKLAELKKENDENQKTLQNTLKDLKLKATELGKEVIGIKTKQDTLEQLITSVSEKQKKSIANVKVRCDILNFQIKEQGKKFDEEKIEVSKRLSEFTIQCNSKLQQLDTKIQTETKNMNDQYNAVRSEILLIKDANRTTVSKLNEMTKDLSGQMIDIVSQVSELAKDLDSRCLQVRETFEVAVNKIEARVKELEKCNSQTTHKQTTMEEQIRSLCLKYEHFQKEGENGQKFRQVVNVKLLNLENKIDETVKSETRNRSTEIKSLRSELEPLGRELQKAISKVVDLQLNLDAVSKTMNERCNQVQAIMLAKVNQLFLEAKQTNTAIEQCKQDTQEVKQMQTDINSQISAIGPKQNYFEIKVEQVLTKMNKCEERCRNVSECVKRTEVDGIVTAVKTEFQGLYSRLSDMDKNHSDVVVNLRNEVDGTFTAVRTEFQGLYSRLSDMDKNHSDVVVNLRKEVDGTFTAVRTEFQGLYSRLSDMDKYQSEVVVNLKERVDGIVTDVRTEFQGLYQWRN